jgi:TonB family protein
MIKRFFVFGIVSLMAMTSSPAISAAQPNSQAAMPRLALPVEPGNYPDESLVASEEGSVVLIATIGVDGQMSNARVESSSGHSRLDEASIILANEARLSTPPTNAAGEPVSVEVFVDIVWELPPDTSVAAQNDLELDPSSAFAVAYFKPDVDFAGYDSLIIDLPEVAFREGWRLQHGQATSFDMERIRRDCAQWFLDVFTSELQDEGGFQFVDEAGENVLLIRAGIGELDVIAPFLASTFDPGYSIAQSGTTATLVLELFDSSSGETLARVFDRQQSSSANFSAVVTRASNQKDARDIFAGWAELLHARLVEGRIN